MSQDIKDNLLQIMTFDPGSEAYTAARLAFELRGAVFPMFIPKYHEPFVQKNLQYFEVPIPNDVLVYPNPATNYVRLNVELSEKGDNTFILYNSMGQEVLKSDIFYREMLIELKDFANGSYTWEILRSGKEKKTGALIKQ